ncbi:MAG: hypothetical protein JJT94_07810 [Bernardetiaceae bacterium]|nr:hypothetical protein [Bernardetiaceae bacterium]
MIKLIKHLRRRAGLGWDYDYDKIAVGAFAVFELVYNQYDKMSSNERHYPKAQYASFMSYVF